MDWSCVWMAVVLLSAVWTLVLAAPIRRTGFIDLTKMQDNTLPTNKVFIDWSCGIPEVNESTAGYTDRAAC